MKYQHYFSVRWQATIPFQDLFWRDMILLGTLINLLVTFVGLMLVAQGHPSSWAVLAHFMVLPYNIFLVLAVFRWPDVQVSYKTAAVVWLVITGLA
jgi:hypothetical protein